MTVLVTGAGGLVGTHVLEALRTRGERPRALVHDHSRALVASLGAEPIAGDVTDPATWRRASDGIQAIVHAAALVTKPASWEEYDRVNVGGTRLAVEAARRVGARLVHVSSVAIYGRTEVYAAGPGGVTEDYPLQPLPAADFYARSKRAAELLVREEVERGGLSAIAIRPNVIYGERDVLFTKRLIVAMRRRVLPQIGLGKNHLSCVYVGNVAAAILAAVDGSQREGFRAYHVTCDAPPLLTQREFFETFAHALGVRPRFVPVPLGLVRAGVAVGTALLRLIRPGRYAGLGGAAISFLLEENPFSTERSRSELGWMPHFDTGTAIRRSVRF